MNTVRTGRGCENSISSRPRTPNSWPVTLAACGEPSQAMRLAAWDAGTSIARRMARATASPGAADWRAARVEANGATALQVTPHERMSSATTRVRPISAALAEA